MTKLDIELPDIDGGDDRHLFEMDGEVLNILPGCGIATVLAPWHVDLTLSRGTDGIHFEELKIGQRVKCDVAPSSGRVVHVHQQTQPMVIPTPPKR